MIALSLGWGIQSFTMAAMSALGELPKVDVAIHADTTHERQATYEFAARSTSWLEEQGIKVITVYPKRFDPINNGYGWPDSPFYVDTDKGGKIKRQCTTHWKILPIRRYLQYVRDGQSIVQWIGHQYRRSLANETVRCEIYNSLLASR